MKKCILKIALMFKILYYGNNMAEDIGLYVVRHSYIKHSSHINEKEDSQNHIYNFNMYPIACIHKPSGFMETAICQP